MLSFLKICFFKLSLKVEPLSLVLSLNGKLWYFIHRWSKGCVKEGNLLGCLVKQMKKFVRGSGLLRSMSFTDVAAKYIRLII